MFFFSALFGLVANSVRDPYGWIQAMIIFWEVSGRYVFEKT